MQLLYVKPKYVTFTNILLACATMGALEEGMEIHQRVFENDFASNFMVVEVLIGMYAKCGRIHKAQLNGFVSNVVVVNALIGMYAKCGRIHKA